MKDGTSAGGNWPVMITPFKTDKSIDWKSLDSLIEWYLEAGSSGLFAVCQSSEMFYLNAEEHLSLAKHVVTRVANRVPVIATGTFSEIIDEQAEFIKKMYETGVVAVIVLTNHLAKQDESESVWINNAQELTEKTENIPIGLYECPAPYKRLIPSETTKWIASTNRFFWTKDTSEDINQIKKRLDISVDSNLSLYNAHTASLLESLKAGAYGFSGIAANFYPSLFSWICENWQSKPELSHELQSFLTWGQKTVNHKYVSSAKQYLALNNVIKEPICRNQDLTFSSTEIYDLKLLCDKAETWHKRLGLIT